MPMQLEETPSDDDVQLQPWKYIGYKDLTSFIASDSDLFAIRRFDRLHTRVLLTLQSHLTGLEEQLDALDIQYSSKSVKIEGGVDEVPRVVDLKAQEAKDNATLRDINNGSIRDDMPCRVELVSRIQRKLMEYDHMILKYFAVRSSLSPAPKRNIDNLRFWFNNHRDAINDSEKGFIDYEDELVSVAKPKSRARWWLESRILAWEPNFPSIVKPCSKMVNDTDRGTLFVIRDDALSSFGSVFVFIVASIILILPLWTLYIIQDTGLRLLIISVFVLVFLAFLTAATLSRPFERLATTAGYAAVLVVFMQLGPVG